MHAALSSPDDEMASFFSPVKIDAGRGAYLLAKASIYGSDSICIPVTQTVMKPRRAAQ